MVLPPPSLALHGGVVQQGRAGLPPTRGTAATHSGPRGSPEALSAAASTISLGIVVGAAFSGKKGYRKSRTAPSAQVALAPPQPAWQPELTWDSLHAGLGVGACCLGALECARFALHLPPTQAEAVFAVLLHMALCLTRLDAMHKIPYHWQVTFYASLGWNFWAASSLLDVMFPKVPLLQSLEFVGGIVCIASCVYFYKYQWGRMIRHVQQSRVRPFYIIALTGLMACHCLDVGEFCLAHWFGPLFTGGAAWRDLNFAMWQDQWWWIADVRLCELLATSMGLFGIIVAASGQLEGRKNAYATIGGTVALPMAILFTSHWTLAASFHAPITSPYFLR